MKCTIPEISWHNRDPVLSLDFQPNPNEGYYRLASGGADSHVLIWHMNILPSGAVNTENVADLQRHQRSVNVVRWSPSGLYLASGDDDANIIIWNKKTDNAPLLEEGNCDKEIWIVNKVLRGHKQDVYDICWSPNSQRLISGSIDNTSILWDFSKGKIEEIISDHKGFVQGVAWDPKGQYLATLSADRILRIFNSNGKVKSRISKGLLPVSESHKWHNQTVKYFHDDTLKTYFRRLVYSPDGNLIITPAGYVETEDSTETMYASYVFTSDNPAPVAILPSPGNFTMAVKCCPLLFELHLNGPQPIINLPYRMIIAVATRKAVLLYDTQQLAPFAVITNMHYSCLTDIAWSADGLLLAISSIDGYCSLLSFEPNELGTEYVKEESEVEENVLDVSGCEQLDCDPSVPNKPEEMVTKTKRPNILEQWAIRTPKKLKTDNKHKEDMKNDFIEIVNDDCDVLVEKKADTPNNTASAKPIAVRRLAKNNTVSLETDSKSTVKATSKSDINLIEVRRKPKSNPESIKTADSNILTKSNSEVKPIAVRRKPRVDVSNISPSLPEEKTVTSSSITNPNKQMKTKHNNPLLNFLTFTSKHQNSEKEVVETKIHKIVDDTNAQDSWPSKENLEKPKDVTIDLTENSLDLKLHLDESTESESISPCKEEVEVINRTQESKNINKNLHAKTHACSDTSDTHEIEQNKDSSQETVKGVANGSKFAKENCSKKPVCIEMSEIQDADEEANEHSTKHMSEIVLNPLKTDDSNKTIDKSVLDKNIENVKTADRVSSSGAEKHRRIPLITLSSPKNKKKI